MFGLHVLRTHLESHVSCVRGPAMRRGKVIEILYLGRRAINPEDQFVVNHLEGTIWNCDCSMLPSVSTVKYSRHLCISAIAQRAH